MTQSNHKHYLTESTNQRSTRAVPVGCCFGLLPVLGCIGFCFWVPLYTFCVLKGFGVLGFLCMLEALCVILVYLEALDAFFGI
jgi:hypothetical protein